MRTHRQCGIRECGLTISLLLVGAAWSAGRAAAADPLTAAIDLRAKYLADIEELAKWCEQEGLIDQARQTRHVVPPQHPYKFYLPVLSEVAGPAKLPADAPEKVLEWEKRFNRLRHDYTVELYEIARRTVRAGHAGLAFDLALLGIEASPDFEPLRHLLGYQKYHDPKSGDQWRTLYEVKKLRSGYVWSDKFGWILKAQLHRYEEGQRFVEGRWITAADDAKLHHNIRLGWNIETEHYSIRTDHSIEAAVDLGVKLERLYRIWQELFIRYYASEADVVALFDGHARSQLSGLPRHQVVYFRDRDDYDRSLKGILPNDKKTEGIYIGHTAYFFVNNEHDDRTIYHEATHQMFHESRAVPSEVAPKANFWIVEGIAMYMESLRQEDGYYVLGGFEDERVHAAQVRLLRDKFYVPLEEFSGYGMARLQKDSRINTLYSQAAGLTDFLVHYENGRYRDALVQYLFSVYTFHDGPATLSKLTGVSYNELDKQYRQFMESGIEEAGGGEETAKEVARPTPHAPNPRPPNSPPLISSP